VLLDLPQDVLGAQIDEASVVVPETILLDAPAAPPDRLVEETLKLLESAARPVIVAGTGAWQSGCETLLKHFAELSGIPVYSDFQAHGLLPSSHPLYGGTTHKLSDLTDATGRPDVVLALGLRFGLFTLGASDRLIPTSAKLIHVEIDAKEINRLRPAQIAIVAESHEMLCKLINHSTSIKWPDRKAWQRVIAQAKIDRRKRAADDLARATPPIHPYQAVTAIADALPKDSIVIGDGAEAYHWFNEVVRQETPGSYITHGFLGDVGFGMGLSLGAQVAHPNRRVLCLAGDGAVGFNIAEFDTMVRFNLPIVVVVMNNRSWAASQHYQEAISGANRVTHTQLGGARYDEVAKGFGGFGAYVARIEDLAPALKAAFESGKPACVNIEIDVKPLPPELHLLMSR
jgi:acetolactate synthase-1/2/3 large subunit